MAITRRQFLKRVSLFTAGAVLPWEQLFSVSGSASPAVAWPAYFRSYHKWHCNTFFNFENHLSSPEKAYLEKCFGLLDSSAYQVKGSFVYSQVSYSHRVKKDKVNSTRMYYGSFLKAKELQPFIFDIYKSRGIKLFQAPYLGDVSGLGWDFEEDHFKVYVYIKNMDQLEDADLFPLRKKVEGRSIYPQGLVSYTFVGKKIVEKKIYVASKDPVPPEVAGYPFSDSVGHTNFMVTTKRGIVPQVDLDDALDLQYINETGRKICRRYTDPVDTIAYYDRDHYALYFP